METFDNSPEANSPQSISSVAGIPASPSAKPVSVAVPMIQGIFGQSSRDCFAYFDLDTSYWKTSQATFLSDLEQFSETWPDSGSMRSGRVYGLQTSERPISESASSSWPTARREDGESCGNHPGATDSLTGATRTWATPNTRDHHPQGPHANYPQRQTNLSDQVKWLTPH